MSSPDSGAGESWLDRLGESLPAWLMREHTRSPIVRIFLVGVVLISLILTLSSLSAAGATSDRGSIPTPELGVERTYDGTYRILANNDEDVPPGDLTYDGPFPDADRTLPIELGRGALSPTQALRYAATTDIYRTQLTEYSTVPYQDAWIPFREWQRLGPTRLRIVPIYTGSTYDGPTDKSGEFYVQTTNQYGEWRPVYQAAVRFNQRTNDFELTNPDEAMVHSAKAANTIARALHATSQYLQYSANAPSTSAAQTTSAVPMADGRELYPTVDGGYMRLAWRDGRHAVVKDTWIGVNNIWQGAWYRGRYVAWNQQLGAYVPWDYRIDVPDDYHYETSCTVAHHHSKLVTLNNTTYTKTWTTYTHPPKTEWADYRLLDSTAAVESVRLADVVDGAEFSQIDDRGVWLGMDEATDTPYEFPPGDYTLTATVRASATVEKRWGVTSEECPSFSDEETESYTVRQSYAVPVTVTSWNAEDLEIDVTVVDGLGKDRVIVRWDGDQDLPANPWQNIRAEIGEKTLEIDSPWRFYSVSRNTHIEERTSSGVTTHDATHSHNDRWPAMFHTITSVANLSVTTDSSKQPGWFEGLGGEPAVTLAGNHLPNGVEDPENEHPTTLYHSYAGDIRSLDGRIGEPVSVTATTVFGTNIENIEVNVMPARRANLSVQAVSPHPDREGSRIKLRLTTGNGEPLSGRDIHVYGAQEQILTTSTDGIAWTIADGPIFRARFKGDAWNASGPNYYGSAEARYLFPTSFIGPVADLDQYLDHAVNRMLLISEWILLGIFALWWIRSQKRGGFR